MKFDFFILVFFIHSISLFYDSLFIRFLILLFFIHSISLYDVCILYSFDLFIRCLFAKGRFFFTTRSNHLYYKIGNLWDCSCSCSYFSYARSVFLLIACRKSGNDPALPDPTGRNHLINHRFGYVFLMG